MSLASACFGCYSIAVVRSTGRWIAAFVADVAAAESNPTVSSSMENLADEEKAADEAAAAAVAGACTNRENRLHHCRQFACSNKDRCRMKASRALFDSFATDW